MKLALIGLITVVLPQASHGDACGDICSLIPGSCSRKGSYCKNAYACMDLFWFTERSVLCNSENSGCVGKRELLCSEAMAIVGSRNSAGVVSVLSGSTTTTSRPTMSTTTTTTGSTTITTSTGLTTSTGSTTTGSTTATGSTTTGPTTTTTSTTTTTRSPISTTTVGQTELGRVLEAARRIVSAGDAELESAPVDFNINSLLVPFIGTTSNSQFSGVGDSADLALPMIARALGAAKDRCLYLFEFMIDPVPWFWFTQSSVAVLRDCCAIVASAPGNTDRVLIETISRIIQIVYAPSIERFVRIPQPPIPSDIASRSLYRQSLITLSRATDAISRQVIAQIRSATIRDYSRFLQPRETQFLNRLIDSNFRHPSLPYLGNFVHYKDVPMALSRLILESVSDYDRLDLEQMIGMDPARVGVYWYFMNGLENTGGDIMDNYQSWLNSVGSYLYLIWDANNDVDSRAAVYNDCITSGFFETFALDLPEGRIRSRSDMSMVFRYLKSPSGNPKQMYQCFYDSLISGRLSVPRGTIGRLSYFLHETTTASRWW